MCASLTLYVGDGIYTDKKTGKREAQEWDNGVLQSRADLDAPSTSATPPTASPPLRQELEADVAVDEDSTQQQQQQ